MKTTINIFAVIVIVRFITTVLIRQRWKYPDQYYQGPEVSHYLVFGNGFLTWEWTMEHPIRSMLFPEMLGLPYRALRLFGLDETWLLPYGPSFYQFIITCLHDIFLVKLNRIINGPSTAWEMLLLSYTNFVSLVVLGWTLVNNTECVLTLIAFYYWHRRHEGYNDVISRLLVLLCFCVRGTSIMFWVIVWPYELLIMQGNLRARLRFILKNLLWVAAMVVSSMTVAYLYYGKPHLVEYNFFYYNFVLDWSSKFGVDPWHQFLTKYFIDYLNGMIPVFLLGLYFTFRRNEEPKGYQGPSETAGNKPKVRQTINYRKLREIVLIIAGCIFFLSINSHKEDRFQMFFMPLCYIIAFTGWKNLVKVLRPSLVKLIKIGIIIFGLSSSYRILYVQHDAYYAEVLSKVRFLPDLKSIYFFCGAHTAPLYSDIHHKIPLLFPITTPLISPNECNIFDRDPKAFYRNKMQQFSKTGYPSHIITLLDDRMPNVDVDLTYYEQLPQMVSRSGIRLSKPMRVFKLRPSYKILT